MESTGTLPFRSYTTWYQTFGDLKGGKRPLVVLHGGPGTTHIYLRSIRDLATLYDIPVIFYDQVGCGNSTHLPHEGADFFTIDFFLAELDSLLEGLGIGDDYDLLGHSWGGVLGMEHALRDPKGLKHLVLADTPAAITMWGGEMARLLRDLPHDVQETVKKHEEAGTTNSPEYQAAMQVFNAKHVCRMDPVPEDLQNTFKALSEDPTVYMLMCGPSEFHVTGTLKTWTIIERLHDIKVSTLVLNGKYDEVTEKLAAPLVERIPNVKRIIFEESSHTPHLEERVRYMKVVGEYLLDGSD